MLWNTTMPSLHQVVENLRIQRDIYQRNAAISAARSGIYASPRCCTTFDAFNSVVLSQKPRSIAEISTCDVQPGGIPVASKLTITRRALAEK